MRSMIFVVPIGGETIGQVQVLVVDLPPAEVFARISDIFREVIVGPTQPTPVAAERVTRQGRG